MLMYGIFFFCDNGRERFFGLMDRIRRWTAWPRALSGTLGID